MSWFMKQSPHNWVVFHPLYPLNNLVFFIAQMDGLQKHSIQARIESLETENLHDFLPTKYPLVNQHSNGIFPFSIRNTSSKGPFPLLC